MTRFHESNHTQWGVIIAFVLVIVIAGGVTYYGARTSGKAIGDEFSDEPALTDSTSASNSQELVSSVSGVSDAPGMMGVAAVAPAGVGVAVAGKPPNGHTLTEIGGIPACAAGQVLTASSNGKEITLLCVTDATGTGGTIGTGSITTTQIADGAITTAKIATSQITGVKLAADTVTADKIAAGAVTGSELAQGAVTADKLAVSSCPAGTFLTVQNNVLLCAAPAVSTVTPPGPSCKPISGQLVLAPSTMTVTGTCNMGQGGCGAGAIGKSCSCTQYVSPNTQYYLFSGQVCVASSCQTLTNQMVSNCPTGAACAISCPSGYYPQGSLASNGGLSCAPQYPYQGNPAPSQVIICYP